MTDEDPDRLGRVVAAMEALPGEVEKIRRDFTRRTDAITSRATANRRWARFLIGILAAGVLLATAAAVTALVLLAGTVSDVRDNQETITVQQLAACGFHRGWVEIPAAAASAQAARTPGSTPSPNPYLDALVAKSATAYNLGGCVPKYGPLPTAPGPSPAPTPSR